MRRPVSRRRHARTRSFLIAGAFLAMACSGSTGSTIPTATAPATAPATATATAPATTTTTPPVTSTLATSTTIPATTTTAVPPDTLPALQTLLDAAAPLRRFSLGPDTLGVWICHVSLDIDDPIYNASDLRLDLTPDGVADLMNQYIGVYYRALSHDLYQPKFVPGGEVSIVKGDTNRECVERARATAEDRIDGLIVVADAEHASNQPGGWGRPGETCPLDDECSARLSGRATYIGASDFHPDWGPKPAIDLEEHEIGHSLGFPHSGDDNRHTSALDLMSNSAAPRDVDPDRRDGPDTLAVNRLAAGWLPLDAVTVIPTAGGRYRLTPSNGADGQRLLVLPLDELRFLTVELIDNEGINDHLPAPGIAIHLIDQRPEACRFLGSAEQCHNELRRQTPLASASPNTDLISVGEDWTGDGWTVRVVADGPTWTVEIG